MNAAVNRRTRVVAWVGIAAVIVAISRFVGSPKGEARAPLPDRAGAVDRATERRSDGPPAAAQADARRAADAKPSPAFVLVRVETRSGATVAGANVVLSNEDGEQPVGVTDDAGVVRVPVPSNGIAWRADASNGDHGSVEFRAQLSELTIIVAPHRLVRGRIQSPYPIDAASVFVLARQRSKPPPDLALIYVAMHDLSAGRGASVLPVDLVRTDGTFVLEVEDLPGSWLIEAGGAGMIGADRTTWEPTAREEVVVSLQACAGICVHVEDEAGAPPVVSPALGGSGPFHYSTDSEHVRATHVPATVAVLAGIEPAWAVNARDHRLLLFVGDTRAVEGVASIRLEYPGYEPKNCDLPIDGLASPIQTHPVQLRRIAEGWGTVRIEARGAPPDLDRAAYGAALRGNLLLESETGERHAFPLDAWNGNLCIVESVPTGIYRARFQSRDGPFCSPAAAEASSVVRVERDVVTLPVDFSAMSVLLLEPDAPSHATFDGPLRVLLSEGTPTRNERGNMESHGARLLELLGPPYLVGGWTGARIAVKSLYPRSTFADGFVAVDALPGRVTGVSLSLADR